MTGQGKEAAWRVFGLAGKPQHKREHRERGFPNLTLENGGRGG
jgi:hypothetical protein